ncbi:MAG: hypothetical protein MRY32_01060 [Rickettsiales bacterium]|nr:hypothetical protein [Rickettsiales bacterium]
MATFGDIVKPDFFEGMPDGDKLRMQRDSVVGKVLSVGAAKEAGILTRLSDAGAKMDQSDAVTAKVALSDEIKSMDPKGLDGTSKGGMVQGA